VAIRFSPATIMSPGQPWPRLGRAARTHRQSRRNRRPAAAWPAPATDPRVPPLCSLAAVLASYDGPPNSNVGLDILTGLAITLPLHAGRARSREPSTPVSW